MMLPRRLGSSDGYALLATVVVVAVLLTVAASSLQLTRTDLHSTADQSARQQAFYIAEAGIQRGIAQLNYESAMASNYTTYSYSGSSESFANGSYVISITQDPQFSTDPTRKLITSTGTRSSQSAQIEAHAVVQPVVPPDYDQTPVTTPTLGPPTTPTPSGPSTPTPPGPPNFTPAAGPVNTPTPGPPPTETPGTPPGLPTYTPTLGPVPTNTVGPTATPTPGATATPGSTPTPTPTSVPIVDFAPCDHKEMLVSYNGTARFVNNIAALTNFIDDNGRIFSNGDVTFQSYVNAGNTLGGGSGAVFARSNFNNAGLGLGLLSNFNNVALYLVNASGYQRAALDTHLLGCGLACLGNHFGTVGLRHGTTRTIRKAYPWRPDWNNLKQAANQIVNRRNVPFGSWDSSTGTWNVNSYNFPADDTTLYYVEGNVRIWGISLFHRASPHIVARGAIVVGSINVIGVGLASGEAQSVYLIAEKDVMIGRDVVDYTAPTWQSETVALTAGLGINLVSALDYTINVTAYSEKGEVWGVVSDVAALNRTRVCFIADDDATLAFTGTVAASVRPLN